MTTDAATIHPFVTALSSAPTGPFKMTPALARAVAKEAATMERMPVHSVPGWRPVVVVAQRGKGRPWVGALYRPEAVGTMLPTGIGSSFDHFTRAQIVAAL